MKTIKRKKMTCKFINSNMICTVKHSSVDYIVVIPKICNNILLIDNTKSKITIFIETKKYYYEFYYDNIYFYPNIIIQMEDHPR